MKSKKKKKTRRKFGPAQKTILGVIVACFVIVIFGVIFALINRPQIRIPRLITQMSEDYYENYLYKDISESENFKNDPDKTMKIYVENGFSPVKLRMLLLYDNQKNAKYADEIKEYCKDDSTWIKFYPEAPYGKKNYRVEYSYSCDF